MSLPDYIGGEEPEASYFCLLTSFPPRERRKR
jgi:hypothetical protein